MHSFFDFFRKFHVFFLFLFLEALALILTVRKNSEKMQFVLSSANSVSGFFYKKTAQYIGYFNLREQNTKLHKENVALRNAFQKISKGEPSVFRTGGDSVHNKYRYSTATVIKNSVSLSDNFLTIDKGLIDGIEPEMVLITHEGVVGVIVDVSKHFAVAVSLLNSNIGISCKLQKSDFFGTVTWSGRDYRIADLNEIPNHIDIKKGDTVVTSGYSALFPENIPVGTVVDFNTKGENNFYEIRIKLTVDFKKIRQVYVVKNLFLREQKELEKKLEPEI